MKQPPTRHLLCWSELKLAVFFSVVIVLVVFTIFFSNVVYSIFQKNIPLIITISDVGGLKTGAPVWLQGVTVGSVQRIDVLSENQVVYITIGKKYQPFLYKNTSAEIKAVGLLGSKYVELNRGTQSSGKIEPNQKIDGKLVDPLENINLSLTKTVSKLSTLLDSINNGSGTAGMLVNDTTLASELKTTTYNLRVLFEEMKKNPKKFFNVKVF
jgi:phospholipid/cholesterol/gamma-HCH transport system substrate-binding protein